MGILKGDGGLLTPDSEWQEKDTSIEAAAETGWQQQQQSEGVEAQITGKRYACALCSKAFAKPCRLAEHWRTHSGERPFVCAFPGCGKAYMRDTHLAVHSRMHVAADKRPYVCALCDKTFATNQRLRRHAAVHSDPKPHVCVYGGCGRAFGKRAQLHVHECSHTGENPHACDQCAKSFAYPSQLKRHKATHSADDDARYRCTGATHCSETFAKWSQLQAHRAQAHRPEPYACDVCHAQFKKRYELAAHLKRHDPDRPVFLCAHDGCPRSYLDERALRMHERMVHSPGARRFLCPHSECLKSYAYPHSLRKHVKAVHQNGSSSAADRDNIDDEEEEPELGAPEMEVELREPQEIETRRSPTVLEIASGVAYSDPSISGRLLQCSVAGCRFRFKRPDELSVHLGAVHNIV